MIKRILIILLALGMLIAPCAVIVNQAEAIQKAEAGSNMLEVYDPSPEIQAVFDRLLVAAGNPKIKLYIGVSPVINAFADGRGFVVIFEGNLKFMKYDMDKIAFILAHEIAHHTIGHLNGKVNCDVRHDLCEANADTVGRQIAKDAGFNVCKGAEVWNDLYKRYGDEPSESHPGNLTRYNDLKCNIFGY